MYWCLLPSNVLVLWAGVPLELLEVCSCLSMLVPPFCLLVIAWPVMSPGTFRWCGLAVPLELLWLRLGASQLLQGALHLLESQRGGFQPWPTGAARPIWPTVLKRPSPSLLPPQQGGDLRTLLSSEEAPQWASGGRQIALDIAEGLVFLHACNITHRCAAAAVGRGLLFHTACPQPVSGADPAACSTYNVLGCFQDQAVAAHLTASAHACLVWPPIPPLRCLAGISSPRTC